MKILTINSVYGYGSTGKIVKNIHHNLLSHGHESFVIYGRNSAIGTNSETQVDEENVFYIANAIEQTFDLISSYVCDTHGLHSKSNTKKIIKKIEEIQPDLIQLHNIHGFYINYPMLFEFLKQYNKPVVWTLHDCWSYTGYCAYYDYAECDGWKTGCKQCRHKSEYPYRILSQSEKNYELKKNIYSDLNVSLVTPSEWLKDEVSKSILSEKDCKVIHNDVDLSKYYYEDSDLRKKYCLEGKRVYLACANVWNLQKGWNEYLKFAQQLNVDERLVMIGVQDNTMMNLPLNVIGIGRVDQDTLRKWYSLCDAFVNLTLEDNYPTVNLEAASCGAPVVTYLTGGSIESAGTNGIGVERKNIVQALEKARTVKRNKKKIHHKNHMYEEYESLYQRLIKES